MNPLNIFNTYCLYFLAAPTATTNTKASATFQYRNRVAATTVDNNMTNNNHSSAKYNLKWTIRSAWQAASPLHAPTRNGRVDGVSHVLIHHTATPAAACRRNANACAATVRATPRTHQQGRGWDDIGYNFLIGGSDDRAEIYEGRGFDVVGGTHAVDYNARSVGIALIGDWTDTLPPSAMLVKLQKLIIYGVQVGYIHRSYALPGHRQVKGTYCPGNRLCNELKEWAHYAPSCHMNVDERKK
ncbi:PREDICTED: peptidoglycan-recognition protein SB1-like [Rhagoletis zephyria]|uniref:peptidoglycan-recognition protein SB1-like n=1 Tax=Rhagoletis zephyria TaxID=28612 RepID=UPI0008114ECA|nr:PREDICTED: peptidoglycan-recognition protein SB1-like [Rhagoletis zephyria]